MHWPLEQTPYQSPQEFPHPPQLAGSCVVSVQEPLQAVGVGNEHDAPPSGPFAGPSAMLLMQTLAKTVKETPEATWMPIQSMVAESARLSDTGEDG